MVFDLKLPANVQYFLLMLVDISNLNILPEDPDSGEVFSQYTTVEDDDDDQTYSFGETF